MRPTGPEPTRDGLRLAAVVLAAGAGSRYSEVPGGKLLADLGGRPVLAHVIDGVRAFSPSHTVVVLGHAHEEIERAIEWEGERLVVNPDPARGLSSSLRLGFATLASLDGSIEGVFIILGDQPLLRTEVMRALADVAWAEERGGSGAVALVPRYLDEGRDGGGALDGGVTTGGVSRGENRNPVLLLRRGWPLVERAEGDRGLGPLLERLGDAVRIVPVRGRLADVDMPGDLAELEAEAAQEHD
jgi:molybdenum cofactor cytidylyltransferase